MQYRQRNIPVTSKESIEIQTDVNLISELDWNSNHEHQLSHRIKLSQIAGKSGLLRPFSDHYVYNQFIQMINQFRSTGYGGQNFEKRLAIMQKQIQGMLKRNMMVKEGENHEQEYYSILRQKDKDMFALEYKQSFINLKLSKSEARILELQEQIMKQRTMIHQYHTACQQNVMFREYFSNLKNILNSNKNKPKELQKLIDQKLSSALVQFEINLQNSVKNFKGTNKVKNMLQQYSRDLERIMRQDNFTQDKMDNFLIGFYASNQVLKGGKIIERQRMLNLKYEELQNKYSATLAIINQELINLSKNNPQFKQIFTNLQNLLRTLTLDGNQIMNCNGWLGLGTGNSSFRTVEVPVQDARTKHLISLLGLEMKKILHLYPKIRQHISSGLLEFLSLEILEQSVEVDSLDRLKEIIVYQNDVIKVDNVYNYSNKQDKDLIFHLRVLIKSLLEEIGKIGDERGGSITLDQGILGLLKAQVIEGIDVQAIIGLYRPQPKIVEVEKIVQRPVYINGTLEKGVPVKIEKCIVADTFSEKAVQVVRQVPIFVEKPVDNVINNYIEVNIETQKVVNVPTFREVIVEKFVTNDRPVDLQVQKIVPLYEDRIVQVVKTNEIIVKEPEIVEIEKPVAIEGMKQYIEIQKMVQKPIYLYETREKIRQIQVNRDKIFEKIEYIEVEKKVPHIVVTRQPVYIEKQVPKYITNIEQKEIVMKEIVEKIIPYKVTEQITLQVPVVQEKQVVKQVQKQVLVETTHFVKGDRQQIVKQIEIIQEKPVIKQILITKDVEIQKMVPVFIKEEKPVYHDVIVPYKELEVKIINNEIVKVIPTKQEIVKEIKVQTPIPVIIEKEIIKVQTVYIDKLIQKIVEVPRVVEIEKIVEKVVVVPRIVEKVIEVVRIVEKVVPVQKPILQIVEVNKQIPIIKQIQIIKEIIVEKPIIQIIKEVQVIQKQKIVEIIVEKQIPSIVQVEKRIPVELIQQIPIQIFKDRLVQRIVELHEVTVKDRQVMVPFIFEKPIPMIVEKPVVTQKIIENIVKVPQVTTKQVPIRTYEQVPTTVEIVVEKAVLSEIEKQIPGQDIIQYKEIIKQVEMFKERIVEIEKIIQVPKQIYLTMDNIVHEIHDKIISVPVNSVILTPHIVEINQPEHYIHYKEVPVEVQTTRQVPVRTIVTQIKQVQLEHEKIVQVEVVQQKIKQIVNQTKQFLIQQNYREIVQEVPIMGQSKAHTVEVPSTPAIISTNSTDVRIQQENHILQKVVEKIVMLPQIVQVVKHIHDVSQVQSAGIAYDVDINLHTKAYAGISDQLRRGLIEMLNSFKANVNRQPDLKNMIVLLEKYIKLIDEWIRFPKIVQVPKQVVKIVENQRVVLVPTEDHNKQATLSFMVQKLITELHRIREKHKIDLNLDQSLMRLFFSGRTLDTSHLDQSYKHLADELRMKYSTFGSWADSHPFMVNSFLEEHFAMKIIVQQYNLIKKEQQDLIQKLEGRLHNDKVVITALESSRKKIYSDYLQLINQLENMQGQLNIEQIKNIISVHRGVLEPQNYFARIGQQLGRKVLKGEQRFERETIQMRSGGQIDVDVSGELSQILGKLSISEKQRQQLLRRVSSLQLENQTLIGQSQRLKINLMSGDGEQSKTFEIMKTKIAEDYEKKNRIIKENYDREIDKVRNMQSKDSNLNNEYVSQNRKLNEKNRQLQRDLDTQKRNIENAKKQFERQLKNAQTQFERDLSKQQSTAKSTENMRTRITEEYQRKIRQAEDFSKRQLENQKREIERLKAQKIQQSGSGSAQMRGLQEKIRRLEIELENSRKEVQTYQKSRLGQTTYTSGGKLGSQVVERFSTEQMQRSPKVQTYKSGFEKEYISPSESSDLHSREQISDIKSRSSHLSSEHQQYEGSSSYSTQMTLREFMNLRSDDRESFATFIMMKIIERIEQQVQNGILNSYSPSNIYLSNFNPKNVNSMTIKFGAPITNIKNKSDAIYLAPEILAGEVTSKKSVVFTMGAIWDELIHSDTYFKSSTEIESTQHEFRVRDPKLNPILKNTLFEMMIKDPRKRLELSQARRRLSLQKYISSEGKSIASSTSRVIRKQ